VRFDKELIIDKVLLAGAQRHTEQRVLIDTGATISILPQAIARYLNLKIQHRGKKFHLVTAAGIIKAPVVTLDGLIVEGKKYRGIEFALVDLPENTGIKIILGMNFIKKVRLVIDGRKRSFRIE